MVKGNLHGQSSARCMVVVRCGDAEDERARTVSTRAKEKQKLEEALQVEVSKLKVKPIRSRIVFLHDDRWRCRIC